MSDYWTIFLEMASSFNVKHSREGGGGGEEGGGGGTLQAQAECMHFNVHLLGR